MTRKIGWQAPATLLALLGFAIVLLIAPAGDTAPGDLADLSVSKADSPDPVVVGGTLTYSIGVKNLGPQTATGVTVTDQLPSQTILLSAVASKGACKVKGTKVTCEVGNLAADPTGANAVAVTIQVRPARERTITNRASVDSAESDPIGLNDRAEVSTRVVAPAKAPRCRRVRATLVGTSGPDRLVGTPGPDVIVAFGGSDRIIGLSGRDRICAGRGNDRVTAGTAADRVFAGAGADRVEGRGGPDVLIGHRGRDVLIGNRGSDQLRGNRGDDLLRGGRGFDRCYPDGGIDRLRSCAP